MLPHKRGAKSKTLESTQTDKKRERERKRERDEPLLRGEQTKKLSQKKHKKLMKKKRKKKDISLSPCVWSSLFSFLFSSFFRKKEFRNFLQRFFFKGGWWFRCKLHAQFLYICARALSSNTLPERERER